LADPILTVPAVHPKQKQLLLAFAMKTASTKTTSYEEKSKKVIMLKLALHILNKDR
jgi:hypothetical protein